LGLLFVAGATIGAASLILPHSASANQGALWSNVALAYLGGSMLLWIGHRLPEWAIHVTLAIGSLLITRAVLYSGDQVSFYSVWYIWVGLFAFYFFRRLVATAHVAFASALFAVTLIVHPASSPVARWLTIVATLAVADAFIDTLVGRARGEAQQANRSAETMGREAEAARERWLASEAERARVETMARTDDLTGLPNRRAWQEELPRELLRAGRTGAPLCVAMLDLDYFKDYNDEYGHQAGDRLLKQTAAVWEVHLRGTDFLARYGGEEFAIVLPGCELPRALEVVERLRASTPEGTCSAGVTLWDRSESAEELVGRADRALYVAKHDGRDRIAVMDSV
jgi:diguanylate cyclase (GGDEF)-like protein